MADAPRKTIGGREFAFGTMPPKEAMRVLTAIAPPIMDAIAGFTAVEDGDEKATLAAMARAAGLLLTRVPWDDYTATDGRKVLGLESLAEIMFQRVSCDGKPVDITVTFAGRIHEIPEVIAGAMKANYADFLGAARSAYQRATPPSSPSPPPT